MLKRSFDVIGASLAIVLLSPLLLLIALLVGMTSQGPLIYRGRRIGLHGRAFHMYKFRTMVRDAEKLGGTSTGQGDVRITRTGRVLRKYKLDELPQFFNVLKGDMSLVGPRPEVEEYTRLYSTEEQLILSVRPGITDYSSVRFANLAEILGAEEPDRMFAERVLPVKNALRLRYVREQSFTNDLRILVRTARAVMRHGS